MKKILIGIAAGLGLLLVASVVLFQRSFSPYAQAREEAVAYAQERAELVQAEDFYWYNGTETYFAVTGEDEKQRPLIVIIKQDGGDVTILNQENALSESQAIQLTQEAKNPQKILEARIGMEESIPVWEVSYRNEDQSIGYYILSLETGEWVKSIENI